MGVLSKTVVLVKKSKTATQNTMTLPKFVLIRSLYNNKYVTFQSGYDVKCDGADVSSPKSKYEVVPASCGGGVIQLKSCADGWFLGRRGSDSWQMYHGSSLPIDDTTNYQCTLFKPEFYGQTVRLRHVQLGHYVRVLDAEEPKNTLFAKSNEPDNQHNSDVFICENWESPRNWSGPSGGNGGRPFMFEVAVLTKIKIRSAHAVDAISFEGKSVDGNVVVSPQYGGGGGNLSEITLAWPREYLTSISGTFGTFSGMLVITSLEFTTNGGRSFGPYGRENGTRFTYGIAKKDKVGFHGRSSSLLHGFGVFVPK